MGGIVTEGDAAVYLGFDAGGVLENAARHVDADMKPALVSIAVRDIPVPVRSGEGEEPGGAVVVGGLDQHCGVVNTHE